jgi:hypothetical protein
MIVNQKDYDIFTGDPKEQYMQSIPILKEIIKREKVYYQKYKKYTRSFEELNIRFKEVDIQEDKDGTNEVCLNSGYCYSISECKYDGSFSLDIDRSLSEKFQEKALDMVEKAIANGEKDQKIDEYQNRLETSLYSLRFSLDCNCITAFCHVTAIATCESFEYYDKDCDNEGNCTYKLKKDFFDKIAKEKRK